MHNRSRSASNGMDDSLTFDRYYNLTLRYLSYRPRSEKEVLEYLKEKIKNKKLNLKDETENEKLITQIMERLIELKLVDDREFARFWVEQRIKFKRKPIRVIKYELKQKGIEENLIEEILSTVDDNNLDLENAKRLAKKKMDFYRNLSPEKRREKVMGHLLRKGFSYDVVKKIEF